VQQLQLDIGSHLSMSMAGWTHPMDRQALYAAALLAQVKNMLRSEGEEPFVPDWPWPEEPDADAVTDDERKAYQQKLAARSAFGQIRTEGLTDV
jgi:hypothetical protein